MTRSEAVSSSPDKPAIRNERIKTLVLVACAFIFPLVIFEVGARFLVRPSKGSFGTLFHIPLPPFVVVPDEPTDNYNDVLVTLKDGLKLTKGDLWGFRRKDPELGHTNQENAVSTNGWWQSNNIGARSRRPTGRAVPKGKHRLLVFGESYGIGSRVRQEEAWSAVLETEVPGLETVNLAVDGYSMAQAYLRYLAISPTIDYDSVLFMYVPLEDDWRDVNVMRYLARGWQFTQPMPRYVLKKKGDSGTAGLQLVKAPDNPWIRTEGRLQPTSELREHLERYDAFYFPLVHGEPPPIIGNLVSYKLLASSIGTRRLRAAFKNASSPGSEAMQIARRIFTEVRDLETARGRKFLLAVLPEQHWVVRMKKQSATEEFATWKATIEFFREAGIDTIDLLPEIIESPLASIDSGYDKSHYGPSANRTTALTLQRHLNTRVLLKAN